MAAAFTATSKSRTRTLAIAVLLACIGPPAAAQQPPLLLPSAETYDGAGNLYFVDTNRNQVFEVSLAGALTTIAGTGVQGFSGDGAAATSAELNTPQGIAIGSDGTIYIADTGNQRIRSIASGQIATIAGTGVSGFFGDNGPAIAATLSTPTALAIDAQGDLLLCDTSNHRVRSIAAGVITTIAGMGTQGFSGDGSAATAAELDSPAGIAVATNGNLYIADTHNQRLRAIDSTGVIQTIAGTGTPGYSGDGNPATAAQLSLPRGIVIDGAGNILFADANNQRIRSINPQGIIHTIAGSGVQGFAPDNTPATTAVLNTPRSVAISSFGSPVFSDTPNQLVREVAANGELYTVAIPSAPRSSTLSLTTSPTLIYGQGSATVAASGSAATPQGSVTLQAGNTALSTSTLSGGTASFPLTSLSAGTHTLTAAYNGDGLNPATTSTPISISVSPAQVTATASAASVAYGQPIPQLTGTTSGVLPQDASQVSVAFSTPAVLRDAAGSYPINATLSGAASTNYSLAMSGNTGTLHIVPAQSTVTLQPIGQTFYAGQPLTLTAVLASVTSGVPTGEVDFSDGATVVAKATAVSGIAGATYLVSSSGSHSLTAIYKGDGNFLGSTSAAITAPVATVPDFSISAPASSQTVQGGYVASFPIAVSPQGGAFTGSITFSASGLPTGVTATFSPTAIVPGSTGVTVTMNVQTTALAGLTMPHSTQSKFPLLVCIGVPLLAFAAKRRTLPKVSSCWILALSFFLLGTFGCGARTASSFVQGASQQATLTITATGTNIAGAIVVHTTTVSLTVD